ncbi:Metallo-dependent phosphatase-like protein [Colletotrichum phormii]|uniref:Metallo-dependent phosphatase-like protein n=1 Tax=Colletotrichum phormii TaxID=359342 RepID=A0AAJ0EL79_9PEZI|nr:Metallo-dependent phosphatase-like protein [Colletotrichum phormii]KAK1640645.1 Metallo-dependent phosphatase-like protein [Colletotrichum phormii]
MAAKRASTGLVQFLSDLHLEASRDYSIFDFPATAPYLLLSGDVGSLSDYDSYLGFICHQTDRYESVLLVLGNHEFHGLTYDKTLAEVAKLEAEPSLEGRLHILHQRRFDIPGSDVSILGCTLWTMVPEEARAAVVGRVKDFQHIKGWSIEVHCAAHRADLAWLKTELQEAVARGRKVVIATHHGPLLEGTSEPRFTGSPWSSAFATDALEELEFSRVRCWVFGAYAFVYGYGGEGC